MRAYYNEIEPYAAQWLRNLIDAGLIAAGDVDTRSIEDVTPGDVAGYTQCHFFAGIGVWSHALRRAGVPDSARVWTGSCPCQPFSAAGKAGGFADERHLWPAFHHLIRQCRPPVVLGEQVSSPDGLTWLNLVQADLEATGYASGALDTCAAGVGGPHIRQRLYWVADTDAAGREFVGAARLHDQGQPGDDAARRGEDGGERVAYDAGGGRGEERTNDRGFSSGDRAQGVSAGLEHGSSSGFGLVDALGARLEGHAGHGHDGDQPGRDDPDADGPVAAPSCTSGYWRECDWLPFRDGKIRPIEPGTFPMADGAPNTVGRLRAYGNAIVSEVAKEFILAYMEARSAI